MNSGPIAMAQAYEYCMENNSKLIIKQQIGGKTSEVELRITVVDDLDRKFGVAKLLADKQAVAKLVEACIYEQVADMVDAKRAAFASLIEKVIERRVESILQTTSKALEHDIAHNVRKHMENSVARALSRLEIGVSLDIGGQKIAAPTDPDTQPVGA